jgi:hypothetical protein
MPDVRRERIVAETDRYRVEGEITLPHEGYDVDLADYLSRTKQEFIVIVNPLMQSLDGSEFDWTADVLMLARKDIRKIVSLGPAECQ